MPRIYPKKVPSPHVELNTPLSKGAQTRARIFEVAKNHFAKASFENVGMRDIAADAEIDLALVGRYFGSKADLFAECLEGAFGIDDLLTVPLRQFGNHLARLSLSGTDASGDYDAVGLLLNASTSPATAQLVSERFHADFVVPLAKVMGGRNAKMRATLIASYVLGLATMRHALHAPCLKGHEQLKAANMAGSALQNLIDGAL